MQLFSFNHIAISVKDVAKSVDFYQSVFNLNEIKNTASVTETRWLMLTKNVQIHLIPRPQFEITINKAVHFALATKDINTFINHLNGLKIAYSDWENTPNKDYVRDDGIRQIYFKDPDGYWIEVNNDVAK
ncbi:VOC family protein [uncultured Winogradskyella sp.]|uniref:VOC family protein n=1 Tax=uncultured Winogradskyella sp. TaxID=395353 RepID=UPI00260BC552|nr:VOC family protein [uncultured Winogradskyella sp.]